MKHILFYTLFCCFLLTSCGEDDLCDGELTYVLVENDLTPYHAGCTDKRNDKVLSFVDKYRDDLVFWLQFSNDQYVLRMDRGFENMKAQFDNTVCYGDLDITADFYAYSPTKVDDDHNYEITDQKDQFEVNTDFSLKKSVVIVNAISKPYAIRFSNKNSDRVLYLPLTSCLNVQDSLSGLNWQLMKLILGDDFSDFEKRDVNVQNIKGDFIENLE